MSQRSGRTGGRESRFNGNANSTAVSAIRRESVDRVEVERIQRIQRSPVRNEKRELVAADDSGVRSGILLAAGTVVGFRDRRLRRVLVLRIGVHDLDGEVAAACGGGDRKFERHAGDSDVRIQEVEDDDGGTERRIGETRIAGDCGGMGIRGRD